MNCTYRCAKIKCKINRWGDSVNIQGSCSKSYSVKRDLIISLSSQELIWKGTITDKQRGISEKWDKSGRVQLEKIEEHCS